MVTHLAHSFATWHRLLRLSASKGPGGGFLSPWYNVQHYYNAFDWGYIQLPEYTYRWQITCYPAYGTAVSAYVIVVAFVPQ